MKKRTIATLLSLVMAFSLTACAGGSDNNTDSGDVVVEEETEEAEDTDAEDADVEDADSEAEDADAEEEDTEAADASDVFGVVDRDVYTNEYFGIKIEAIDGYSFADDETLVELGLMTGELLGEGDTLAAEAMKNSLESGETVIDCYLVDADFMNSINLTLSSTDSRLTQDDVADMIDASLSMLVSTYESMGASDVVCERETTSFLGEEVPCIRTTGVFEVQGTTIDLDVVQVVLVKDGYTATITATTYMDDETATLLDTVSVID